MSNRRWTACLLAAALAAAGCASDDAPAAAVRTRVVDGVREVTVRHAAGETTVRGVPRRIVTLAPIPIESVVALGVKPAGITWFSRPHAGQPYLEVPPYLAGELEGIPLVGSRTEPSAESIVALKPDLILGVDEHAGAYEVLSRIAPTILFPQDGDWRDREGLPWRRALLAVGEILDRADAARERLAEYDEAAAQARETLRDRIGDETVLLLRTLAKGVRVHGKAHPTMGHVLYVDLGLEAPAAMPDHYEDVFIPMEQLVDYDPDHILLIRGNPEMTRALVDGPLWKGLRAVRNGHVHDVDLYWIRGHGWFGKRAIVADAVRLLGVAE